MIKRPGLRYGRIAIRPYGFNPYASRDPQASYPLSRCDRTCHMYVLHYDDSEIVMVGIAHTNHLHLAFIVQVCYTYFT